jgi:predicted NUDIX family phosphoesterase
VILRQTGKPLTARELVVLAEVSGLIKPTGSAPHKTMNARISEDMIRHGQSSKFMRSFHGQFALRDWSNEIVEFKTKERRLKPLNETILAVPLDRFLKLDDFVYGRKFYHIPPLNLLQQSVPVQRTIAEEDSSYVQIIPLFHISFQEKLLTYKRTSRLPEARLHHTRSINFGGHLQELDRGPLFENTIPGDVNILLYRELFEELKFLDGIESITYFDSIYSLSDDFSRKHVGVCFKVVPKSSRIVSNEPGFHTDVTMKTSDEILSSPRSYDEWTPLVIEHSKRHR